MTKKRVLLRCLLLLLCSLGTTECKSVGARESRRAGAKASSPRRLVDSLEPSGHACGFFVWDFVSAILYDWCKTLSKNWEYEGRGGKKYVAAPSGSILQMIYPCTRYNPSKCMRCGGSFRDHLRLWWSKTHLYSPFDRYLDQTYEKGMAPHVAKHQRRPRKQRETTTTATKNHPTGKAPTKYSFHRAYVLDIQDVWGDTERPRDRRRALKQAVSENPSLSFPMEIRTLKREAVVYAVPARKEREKEPKTFREVLLKLARLRILEELDGLIFSERLEEQLES